MHVINWSWKSYDVLYHLYDIYYDIEFTYKWNKFAEHEHTKTIVEKFHTATSRNECIYNEISENRWDMMALSYDLFSAYFSNCIMCSFHITCWNSTCIIIIITHHHHHQVNCLSCQSKHDIIYFLVLFVLNTEKRNLWWAQANVWVVIHSLNIVSYVYYIKLDISVCSTSMLHIILIISGSALCSTVISTVMSSTVSPSSTNTTGNSFNIYDNDTHILHSMYAEFDCF